MSTDNSNTSGKQAAMIFEEIAAMAEQIDELCYLGAQPLEELAIRKYESQIGVMRELVRRIGWMADLGAGKLGGIVLNGGAEAWLLSPACSTIGRGEA